MSTEIAVHPLLAAEPQAGDAQVPASLLDELRDLALSHDQAAVRSRILFEQLRKMLGQDRLPMCLLGIQTLAARNEPSGARLVAALLDSQTPGAQLLPRIRRFLSTHRLLVCDPELVGESFLGEWESRLDAVVAQVTAAVGCAAADPRGDRVLDRPPLPLLRRMVDHATPVRGGADPPPEHLLILADLVRLECDAYQERVSRLAGSIDPYRVTAVMRALPLLSRGDAEIRDLTQFALWLEAGDIESAFRRRVPREHEVFDEGERPRLAAAYAAQQVLAPLAEIHRRFLQHPRSLGELAGPVGRLLVLGRALHRAGLRADELGLIGALSLVMGNLDQSGLALELDDGLAADVGRILVSATPEDAAALRGFELSGRRLILARPQLGLGDRVWRHDLPTLAEMKGLAADGQDADEADQDADADDGRDQESRDDTTSASAVKALVLNNVGSVSILLGFLRNPKVTSIPGLVGDIVHRTRSGRVLEVIASDRRLYTGHANKDVPRALLESPVNVSVKMLRRFIHVKYVSKTDLRRMARDTSRLRKEVCREIEAYLESLG